MRVYVLICKCACWKCLCGSYQFGHRLVVPVTYSSNPCSASMIIFTSSRLSYATPRQSCRTKVIWESKLWCPFRDNRERETFMP